MNSKVKKFKKQLDHDDSHHEAKRKKNFFKTKHLKSLDNMLRTKDVNRILSLEEKY